MYFFNYARVKKTFLNNLDIVTTNLDIVTTNLDILTLGIVTLLSSVKGVMILLLLVEANQRHYNRHYNFHQPIKSSLAFSNIT